MTDVIAATVEQFQLLNLLGHSLFGAPLEIMPGVDWSIVAKESIEQAVVSVAFNNYQELPLSDEIAEKMKPTLLNHAFYNADCFKKHSYLHNLMTSHNIRYCILKGAASALYYPDMMLRSMGDVDFYISPDQFDEVYDIFIKEQFTPVQEDHPHHVAMKGKKGYFELHFKPIGYSKVELRDIYVSAWDNILEDSELCSTEIATFRRPSLFHHGFILLTHLHTHMISSGVGLRHLLDWALFTNSMSDEQFQEIFEKKFKAYGIWKLAQTLALAAVRNMGMPYKSWMGDDGETADELLSDILSGGNFGRKDRQRSSESLLLSNISNDSGNNKLKRLFKFANAIINEHWKCAKKCPLIYPIGWVFFSARFCVRRIIGKPTPDIVNIYKNGMSRGSLYDRIGLFVPEEHEE